MRILCLIAAASLAVLLVLTRPLSAQALPTESMTEQVGGPVTEQETPKEPQEKGATSNKRGSSKVWDMNLAEHIATLRKPSGLTFKLPHIDILYGFVVGNCTHRPESAPKFIDAAKDIPEEHAQQYFEAICLGLGPERAAAALQPLAESSTAVRAALKAQDAGAITPISALDPNTWSGINILMGVLSTHMNLNAASRLLCGLNTTDKENHRMVLMMIEHVADIEPEFRAFCEDVRSLANPVVAKDLDTALKGS